jgi:hypothetical protein
MVLDEQLLLSYRRDVERVHDSIEETIRFLTSVARTDIVKKEYRAKATQVAEKLSEYDRYVQHYSTFVLPSEHTGVPVDITPRAALAPRAWLPQSKSLFYLLFELEEALAIPPNVSAFSQGRIAAAVDLGVDEVVARYQDALLREGLVYTHE